jgi:histidinol-phosphate aminotransferase
MPKSALRLVRPLVEKVQPYVPGEQPRDKSIIKLNTNENPYPPSPMVLAATKASVDNRLRLYPNPTAEALRKKLAELHGCKPDNIIVGNGSDELLAMAVRCFVEPLSAGTIASRCLVQFFQPSYSLYPVLAALHGAMSKAVPLKSDFDIPSIAELKKGKAWDFSAALTFITTPNAPSGRGYSTAQLEELCRAQKGVVILDEAYVDFAQNHAMSLSLKYPNALVARTFSKAYSLCFQRVGYFVGPADLIGALQKIRDSYNVNGLGQVAAVATLDDLKYYRANFRKIIATREKLTRDLSKLGFSVLPSQTNFILAKPPGQSAEVWLQRLREQKILVRWFSSPEIKPYLRITIGTQSEADALVRAAKRVLDS